MVDITEQALQAAIEAAGMEGWDHVEERMKAALTAAAPYMSGVKVKQLEWGELNEGKTFRALLPIIGSIRVEPYGVCGWWEVLWSMPGQCDKLVPDVFDTPEEAKAAAQADFEKRILSALEPYSAREQALDEVFQILQQYSEHPNEVVSFVMVELWDAIRSLKSQPSSAREQALEEAARECEKRGAVTSADAIRALSYPDHAGAGKVEWNTRAAPAPCDKLETVGWLWEYAQYRTDDRGCYGYETVITESNPTDHVSPAEKFRNVRELVTRQNAEEVIAAKDERIEELERRLKEVELEHTGVRNSYFAEKRKAIALEADNKRLREALEPFAEYGEDYFDKDHNGNPLPDEQGVGWIYMNFGHFRKARAALGEVKP